jgi:SAM-dependent methyltransferase
MQPSWRNAYARLVYLSKAAARFVRWLPSDHLRQHAEDDPPSPPMRLSFVGRGDFERTGQEYVSYFRELGGLQPHHRVLDVGCGIGRMAIPLMSYLDTRGSYAGFDVGRRMIRWCQDNISDSRPDFTFSWAPIFNRKYNPFGNISASEFRFPYPDSSFDFVFATSVFTHLLRPDAMHYLREISRVLRPDGVCLLTFFLLTHDAEREVGAGNTQFEFKYEIDGVFTTDAIQPEQAVAYRAECVTSMLGEAFLEIREPIHFGRWANNPHGLAGQDIIVVEPATTDRGARSQSSLPQYREHEGGGGGQKPAHAP